MRTVKISGTEIKAPKAISGNHPTPPATPKAHALCVLVGRSRAGKSVAAVNLIKMMGYDYTILVSPTANSNWDILRDLNISQENTYDDLDDPMLIDKIKAKVDVERDDYIKYHEELKGYEKLMKDINKDGSRLQDNMLMRYYRNGGFQRPTHRWNGRKPKIALLIDDSVQSKVFGKKLSALGLLYRHIGAIKGEGAIGISPFIVTQVFKCQGNGLPKPIRSNATLWCLFKNYNLKEKKLISEDLSFGLDPEQFGEMWDGVCDSKPYSFLFVDTSPKPEHLSMFRRCFDEFIIPGKKD
tara:strand:- start:561 stop:1451 length:891 start_codon:yes stop_codon:yes gene_type:complete